MAHIPEQIIGWIFFLHLWNQCRSAELENTINLLQLHPSERDNSCQSQGQSNWDLISFTLVFQALWRTVVLCRSVQLHSVLPLTYPLRIEGADGTKIDLRRRILVGLSRIQLLYWILVENGTCILLINIYIRLENSIIPNHSLV